MAAVLHETDYRETERQTRVVDDGEFWRSHVKSALARGLPELIPTPIKHDGNFVLVGSGPSLPQFSMQIRAERENGRLICAVKGAHDWLCEQGIVPDLFISVEPRPRLQQVQQRNERTKYLLASRCTPEMFDWLKDCNLLLWHAYDHKCKDWPEFKGRYMVGGGTTSGMRAISLAYTMLGFRRFVLYGMDSCLAADKKTKRFTGEMAGQVVDRIISRTGQTFYCNMALALQADEFQELYKFLPGITLDVKGEGLLAAIVSERKNMGVPA